MSLPDQHPDDKRVILGNFTLTANMPNGRAMNVAGYIYSDDDPVALNKRLDLYQECIERQRTRCEIPELEGKREQLIQHLEGGRKALSDLEQKKKDGHLSSKEKMDLNNLLVNLGRLQEEITKGEAAIETAKRKAGVA